MEDNRSARSSRVREHFRSNVVGYIAIFLFAVAGTASALPGRNTVDSADIKNKQVKRVDIAPNAVNGSRVADGALGGADISEASLGRVPSATSAANAADAAAIGGTPAAEVVRTDPTVGDGARPFITEGTLNLSDPTDVLDLGSVALQSNDAGSISICSQSASVLFFNFDDGFAPGGSHGGISPGGACIRYVAGYDVINFAADDGSSEVYAIIEDVNRDGLLHAWILG